MSLLVSDARLLADRYRDLRAFGLASGCISRLCNRVEELEAEVEKLKAEIERLDPAPQVDLEIDPETLLAALEEIGRVS